MDNFELYHNLCSIKKIIDFYPGGKNASVEIEKLLGQFATKRYRVAVIGEFKRGKSSLVNTLLGTEILPTDILPTTAVINKIVYDTTQKIVINFKDGQIKETNIEEIHKYATKLDKDKEQMADTIREIVVHYPSIFGQNHIELIDTPGLNDNEIMSETTIEVLDKIDTAIVVISATIPLSMTEQKLICNLIEQKDIYHLMFVVTFIDRISDETEEQDRVIELITDRIREDTYKKFEKIHGDDKELLQKAEKILREPKVFAVSSKLAMQGFIKNDNSLIEKSRFTHFKIQLMALLTGNYELDIHEKVKRTVSEIKDRFSIWVNTSPYDGMISDKTKCLEKIIECRNKRKSELIADLQKLDAEIESTGISLENIDIRYFINKINPKRFFVKYLSAISSNEYTPQNVIQALKDAIKTCCDESDRAGVELEKLIQEKMMQVEENLYSRNKVFEIDFCVIKWRENNLFPRFELTIDMVLENVDNILGDIMPSVIKVYSDSYAEYQNEIIKYVASWRVAVLKHERNMEENISKSVEKYLADIEEVKKLQSEHEKYREKNIEELMNAINKII